MSVTVFNHQHDAALTLDGVGTSGSLLVIQTGTIIFNFQGVSGEGWVPATGCGIRCSISPPAPARF